MNNILIDSETIAAISTPYGKGGIGIIRISGDEVEYISNKFFKKIPIIRKAEYLSFHDYKNNEILDKGIVIFFKKPNSFTGENLLEFQCHGNPHMMSYILDNILLCPNVRLAYPGEFTKRAYLNNKLDLFQSESIINLINSNSLLESRLYSKSVQGIFSNEIKNLIKKLDEIKILIETFIDFSYENIDINLNLKIKFLLKNIINKINNLILNSEKSYLISKGIIISIIGEPNVGKSSLFNLLINKDRSIITSIPGTTRDSINEILVLNNSININLFDTAGIHNTDDIIEKLGIKKTKELINKSDLLILVIDNIDIRNNLLIKNKLNILKNKVNKYIFNIINNTCIPIIIVKNKCDLSKDDIKIYDNYFEKNISLITISAKLNTGINLIIKNIEQILKLNNINEIKFLISKRHIDILKKSFNILNIDENKFDISILSDNISLSQKELLSLININKNTHNSEKILSEIFSKFCIGK
ncbi:tRNA uridine-5-carboxymethylaminomethyl(34) synthesis GTPase MnmE [endosymbiont of Pachyrhynchus infernalis]|uniref:tRNA uridine-5-carboxymethylaminomethyl(34) synthesis GTPase MnmE n=1 Tax=endosymbiont of Pachyrhynchus infernalis TaxID=1971488 RepID=UPI000DC6D81B|nr:tRNA uridine-5-carboxymethylaminomethyl(34) synthesis GTPase MnmE [endosymbiont of Pachyrhynchus infernalis]BBA84961.1 tRNA modification GTPase MnmE [endosymbiont of Pachyrhynchus infernalis]